MATSDVDRFVRVATILLLDNISYRDLLEENDVEKIGVLIFDAESRVRKASVNIFLTDVDDLYKDTLERIGGSVETVEETLGNDKESEDGIPYSWLKYNALVKVLTKYDELVEEAEKENKDVEKDKVPYKGFELGEFEGRIAMAAPVIVGEMKELHVLSMSICLMIGLG
jgi:cohesin complex subunit SA-1/2